MSNVEILCDNNIKSVFEKFGIKANMTYATPKSFEYPCYKVFEISKQDLRKLETMNVEELGNNFGWWRYSKGSNLGTQFEFFTVNGQFMIGWETESKKDSYDNLIDYLKDVGISNVGDICAAAVDIGRANGMSLSKVFSTYYYS